MRLRTAMHWVRPILTPANYAQKWVIDICQSRSLSIALGMEFIFILFIFIH